MLCFVIFIALPARLIALLLKYILASFNKSNNSNTEVVKRSCTTMQLFFLFDVERNWQLKGTHQIEFKIEHKHVYLDLSREKEQLKQPQQQTYEELGYLMMKITLRSISEIPDLD